MAQRGTMELLVSGRINCREGRLDFDAPEWLPRDLSKESMEKLVERFGIEVIGYHAVRNIITDLRRTREGVEKAEQEGKTPRTTVESYRPTLPGESGAPLNDAKCKELVALKRSEDTSDRAEFNSYMKAHPKHKMQFIEYLLLASA